ncbi:monosaccharide ABC transporter membrane protein, CUT2 family [Seinonella peptonophila]|uniref:Autoinducer 2 import system permease protein LsrD n=1 Tax=Seinonella peptonophila TaxID=112248 RepID=A0A1M4Y7D8_9BACL|nr:ABC transporter permease [Seinonella peptonophila]SHF01681.1 monosaccharide ABC transporter membrane protein, CUT2 family [Seinonella peptonophila]
MISRLSQFTKTTFSSITFSREIVLLLLLLLECTIFSFISPYFLSLGNIYDSIRSFIEIGIIALAMTMIIMTGGIDLSVGSLLALVSVVVGFSYSFGLPFPLSMLLGVVIGTLAGLFNGVFIVYFRLHPIAVTLGTYALFRGIGYAISNANAVSVFPGWFAFIGQSYFFGIPTQIYIFLLISIGFYLYLAKTRFGTYISAIGINEEAAKFSGVPINNVKLIVYTLAGFLVSLSSIIYTSRFSTARANAGIEFELIAIAAVVLGGASIKGGKGSVLGTILGLLILAFLKAGLILVGVRNDWGLVANGIVLIIGVFINEYFRNDEE